MRKLKLFLDAKAANTPPRGISKASRVIFSVLTLLLLSIGQMWAADVTFTPGKETGATSVTKSGVTCTMTTMNNASYYQIYANQSGTFSVASGNITKIEFTCTANGTSKYGPGNASANVGSYSYSGTKGTWTGEASSVTISSTAQIRMTALTITVSTGSSEKTLSASPAVIDFGTVEQGTTGLAESVEVTYANLTGPVTYSGLSDAFSASGSINASGDEITIEANTATIGEYEQTLTVTSANDSKSADVTVRMNVVEPFDGLKLTFDVSSNPGEWPTTNSTTTTNYTYTLNDVDYTFALNNVKCNSGYLMLYYVAKLGLPAISGYKLVKVEATNSSGCSTSTQVSVSSSDATKTDITGGAAQTWGTTSTKYTYNLSGTEENTMYYLWIANKNCQIVELTLYYEETEASAVAKPTISGETPFLTSTEVTLTQEEADHIYYTTNGDAPTTSSTLYSAPFEVNATTTIKAIAVKGSDESAVAEKTFTKQTVLTVAEALVEATGSGKYVTGTITSITEVNIGFKNATYVISDISAGVKQNEMIVYRGKYIGGTDFTSADQIHVGDVVLVSGSLTQYNQKNQMAQGNQIETISAAAVAAPEFTPNGGGFMGETDVTITCATDGATIYYTLDGTNPTNLSTLYEGAIHLNATTTITAIAYVGEESSLVVAKEFTLTAPMTVAEAYDALTGDDINNAAVAGIVYQVDNISNEHATYWISDNGEAGEKVLEVYNGYGLNGASIDAGGIQVGDEVTVFGNLTIYVKNATSTKEFAAGSRLLAFNRPEVAVTDINLTESTAEVEVGKTVNLHASVVPANATNKTIVWSVQSGNDYASVDENGVVTGIAAGEAVVHAAAAADENIYAECTVTVTEPAPLSPWASVYTSNVTLSKEGGTSASAAKVKFYGEEGDGYDAIKAGTGSAQGAVVVNVPAGATALHFHAYSWYNETVELTVTAPTGVTVTPSEAIAINKNSGISGSSSTYTLAEGSDPKTDAYYAVSLSGNTEPVALTISATSGKRFVLFGANQEGGLVLESIAISGTASVLEYNDGDNFDPAGLVVTGHYSNGSDAPISEGIDWAFDPDPLTEGTTSVSVTATVGEISSDAFVVNGLTVHGAAPLSPWASVYTSNVTLSTEGGTSASAAKVKFYGEEGDGYDAIKAGTGSAQGAVVVNVPAGATALHFHAYSWYNETVELTVTAPTGVTVTPSEAIAINKNSGISGSSSTYTLAEGSDPKTDAYYAVSLSGNTEPVALTISATSGKRFVLFGVNQEGGVLPVLESIEIKGDLTTKTGYKAGDALDLEGLTVEATYSLGGVAQTPVDITNDPELALTYDPLVENQTEVIIIATYKGQIDDITITGLDPVASADPLIYVSKLNVNFASVEVGDAVPAAETVTVTLTNVASVTATLGGTNADAFSVSPASLPESGDITISILANTDAAASYSATLTISDGEGGADDKTINLSFVVTEPVTPEDPEVRKTWDLSIASYDANPTEEQVTWSATYVNMVADKANSTTAANNYLGGDANNRTSSRFYKNSTLTITPNAKEITSVVFTATSEGYATVLGNSSWTNASASASGTTVTVTPTDGKNAISATIDGTCGFTAVQVNYKNIAPEPPVVDYTEVRNGLTEGWYYTMCLDKAVTAVKAGSIWKVLSKAANGNDVILEEVTGTLDAGRPYIFRAAASTLEVAYTGDAVLTPVNDADNHGLIGSFTQEPIAQSPNNFIIYNNALYYVNSNDVYVGEHRAYLNMNGVPNYEPQQGNAPRRRVTMEVHGEQVATGIDAINASDKPMKLMIEGKLYIIRGEKMFNANGQLVK